jgi:threonyl-tRNA synthetase
MPGTRRSRDGRHYSSRLITDPSELGATSWRRARTPAKEAKTNDTRHARSILNELRVHEVRAEIDESIDKINGKIQRAEQMKVHTMFVIGRRDMDADAVSVRVHGKGNLGAKSRSEAMADILLSMKERRA